MPGRGMRGERRAGQRAAPRPGRLSSALLSSVPAWRVHVLRRPSAQREGVAAATAAATAFAAALVQDMHTPRSQFIK